MKFRQFILFVMTLLLVQNIDAVNVSSIAQYSKLADDTDVTFTCKLTVVAHKGRKLFVTDGKDGAMIFGVFNKTYSHGDVFKEGLTAVKTTFDSTPELFNVKEATMVKVQSDADIKPSKVNLSDITLNEVYNYVSVTGFYSGETGTLKSGKTKLHVTNIFGTQMPTTDGRETVKGILVYHKKRDVMQIYVM